MDITNLEYYDFDEFESIQSEVAFTYTTDFSRQLVSIKIFWKYFVNLFLGKHLIPKRGPILPTKITLKKKTLETTLRIQTRFISFLAKWFLGGISLSLYFTVKNLFPVRSTLPLGIMIWTNFNLPYKRLLPDKLHFSWPTGFLRRIFGL